MDTWTSDEKGGMQAPCPGERFDVWRVRCSTWERSVEVQGKTTLQIVSE